jgi:hypothetical protein
VKIWLDDDPRRDSWVDDTWTIVRRAYPCILLLANAGWNDDPLVEELSLDHDLGDERDNGSGYEIAKWIERQAFEGNWKAVPKRITIHSGNPVGRKNMQAAIDSIERMRK